MKDIWVEKYRPKTVDEYVFKDEAQKHQVKTWIIDGGIPHLLFSGSAGTGKTTLAKVLINDPGSAADGSGEDSAPAQKTADDIIATGGKAIANFDSIADYQSAGKLVNQAVKEWGQVDILVNCAGILRDRMVFNMSKEEWDAVIQVHLYGHFNMISHVSKIMRQNQWGRIINFTSNSGLLGNLGQVNYGAAKAGIAGMTRSIAKDLEKYNITVNAISPVADTRMTADVGGSDKPNKKQSIFAGMKEPEFVAPMIGYLASDKAQNINGKIFYVQGGRVSLPFHPSPEHSIVSDKKIWDLKERNILKNAPGI